MSHSHAYWAPVSALVHELQLWTRCAVDDGSQRWTGPWGMLLGLPVEGYLETSGGPVVIQQVEWVQLALEKPAGGRKGIPLRFRDVSVEVLARMQQLSVTWEEREVQWALEGFFPDRPVRVVHLPNPFWAARAPAPVGSALT